MQSLKDVATLITFENEHQEIQQIFEAEGTESTGKLNIESAWGRV